MSLMTSTLYDRQPAPTRSAPRHAWSIVELDPFIAPERSHSVADVPARSRVVVRGVVRDVRAARWAGGPVLEVALSDGTGELCLAFLGRRRIAGIEAGCELTAAGTVGSRRGRPVVLNPWYWLHAGAEVPDA
ncbi:MAG: hypothetical protein ACT4PW_03915 [Acidimicrobiia bacterium]